MLWRTLIINENSAFCCDKNFFSFTLQYREMGRSNELGGSWVGSVYAYRENEWKFFKNPILSTQESLHPSSFGRPWGEAVSTHHHEVRVLLRGHSNQAHVWTLHGLNKGAATVEKEKGIRWSWAWDCVSVCGWVGIRVHAYMYSCIVCVHL